MSDNSRNGVVISQREIYDQLQNLSSCLARMEPKVDRLDKKMEVWEEVLMQVREEARSAEEKADKALEMTKAVQESRQWFNRMIIKAFFVALITGIIGGVVTTLFFTNG